MSNFPFQRLQTDLAALIERTPAGQRLPSEPDLSKQLGVSRATLRDAMRTFETQGLVRRRQGSGTFVVGKSQVLESGLEALESLETMAKRLGLEVSVSNLNVERTAADQNMAGNLNLAVGAPLLRVRRVMCADSRPVAYLVDTLPETVLQMEDLPADFHGSVLDILLQRGDALTVSRADISATNAAADVAKALEIQRGDVLLQLVAGLYSGDGRVLDYSTSYFIPGYFRFHVVRRVGGR
ncbi:MAG: GntR family transcriptional regulator [Chloroflexi bacterium]|nr:GntR family transcriptional regulator [Chloroflexota bacterium]